MDCNPSAAPSYPNISLSLDTAHCAWKPNLRDAVIIKIPFYALCLYPTTWVHLSASVFFRDFFFFTAKLYALLVYRIYEQCSCRYSSPRKVAGTIDNRRLILKEITIPRFFQPSPVALNTVIFTHWCPTITQIYLIGYRYRSLWLCRQNWQLILKYRLVHPHLRLKSVEKCRGFSDNYCVFRLNYSISTDIDVQIGDFIRFMEYR